MRKIFFLAMIITGIIACSKSDDVNPDNNGDSNGDSDSTENTDTLIADYKVQKYLNQDFSALTRMTDKGNFLGFDVVRSIPTEILIQKIDTSFNILEEKRFAVDDPLVKNFWYREDADEILIWGYTEEEKGGAEGTQNSWVKMIDLEGNMLWKKTYGGEGDYFINSVAYTGDNSIFMTGTTSTPEANNPGDVWIVKINNSGDVLFEKTFGGTGYDSGNEIIPYNDALLLRVKSFSSDNDFSEPGNYLMTIDREGTVQWKTNLQGSNAGPVKILENNEIIAFFTGNKKFHVKKLSASGEVLLSESYQYWEYQHGQPFARGEIMSTGDGGFAFGGFFNSIYNEEDATLFRVNENMELQYFKIIDGSERDFLHGPIGFLNGHYFFQLETQSTDIEIFDNSEGNRSRTVIRVEEEWE